MKIDNVYYAYRHDFPDSEQTPTLRDHQQFLIYCSLCGKGLCGNIVIAKSHDGKQNMIYVEPCDHGRQET